MNTVTIELGIRKFRVPETKASLIEKIVLLYNARGTGRLLITRYLIAFNISDLFAFQKWHQTGEVSATERFRTTADYELSHDKFKLIASDMTYEVNGSAVD